MQYIEHAYLALKCVNPVNGLEDTYSLMARNNEYMSVGHDKNPSYVCVDSVSLDTLRFKPYWTAQNYNPVLYGRMELFVPRCDSVVWSGLVISPQFKINVVNYKKRIEWDTLKFKMPDRYYLDENLTITFDSGDLREYIFPYPKGYTLGCRTRSGSGESFMTGFNPTTIEPFSRFNHEFYGSRPKALFENGTARISASIQIFQNKGRIGHMLSGYRDEGYKILWEKEYVVEYTKDEYKKKAENLDDPFKYVTLIVPRKIYISKENIIFYDHDSYPIECEIKKENTIATRITIGREIFEAYYGPPRSTLGRLPCKLTSDSSLNLNITVYETDPTMGGLSLTNYFGVKASIWKGRASLMLPSETFDITVEEKSELKAEKVWRNIKFPKAIYVNDQNMIVADTNDPIQIEFQKPSDMFVLGRLIIGSEAISYFPAYFPPSLPKIDLNKYSGTSITCTLLLVYAKKQDLSELGKQSPRPFWGKNYTIDIPSIKGN